MRIFYQSLGASRGSRDGHYGRYLHRLLEQSAAAGTQVDIHGLSPHRAVADQYYLLELLDTPEIIENGLRAEREGYDAFVIGNIFQPGLHELRECLNIPVLGLCESAVHVACMMGASFALINVNPKFERRIVESILLQGLSSRMVSIERMTVERAAVFDQAYEDTALRDGIVAQFQEVARRALDKGAEVLLPAGGSLMAIIEGAGVTEVDGAPILNGIRALLKTAEMAVQLRRIGGHFTSKRMTYAPPSGKLLADVRAAYGSGLYPGAV
ncbi:aspartate/glutamate racemase family protein [Pseudochelatococcus sp. B33]